MSSVLQDRDMRSLRYFHFGKGFNNFPFVLTREIEALVVELDYSLKFDNFSILYKNVLFYFSLNVHQPRLH